MEIFTIGHSNHKQDVFLRLVREHGIQTLVDTRSKPVSGYAPFTDIRVFPDILEREGIDHIFMGDSLGGKPDDPSCYDEDGKPDYRKMRAKEEFQDGIKQLIRIAENTVVALMCAEEDPSKCHRRLLIGPALEEHGVMLHHIRKDGSLQTSDELTSVEPHRDRRQARLPLG